MNLKTLNELSPCLDVWRIPQQEAPDEQNPAPSHERRLNTSRSAKAGPSNLWWGRVTRTASLTSPVTEAAGDSLQFISYGSAATLHQHRPDALAD